MRIGEFTDSFLPIVDGVGRVVHNYDSMLGEMGHECYVIAPMTDTGYRGFNKFEIVDYISAKFQQYKTGVPNIDPHFKARMKNVELDIIHAHSPFSSGQTAIYYAKKRGVPLIGSFHSKYRDDFKQAMGVDVLADVGIKIVVDFYERCDQVWTVSNHAADTLREYGYRGNIIIMPNGSNIPEIHPNDRELAKEKFTLGDLPVFLYVGQLNWKKNINRIFLASAEIAKKGHQFKLILAGKGPHEDEIKRMATEVLPDRGVIFTGHIEDQRLLGSLYQCASMFVFPSLYDSAALVVREAAVFGVPSVVVKKTGPSEVITDRENGFLCDDTTESLAAIMEEAVLNPDLMMKIGKKAQTTIPVPWNTLMDDVVNRYEMLIDSYKKLGLYQKKKK